MKIHRRKSYIHFVTKKGNWISLDTLLVFAFIIGLLIWKVLQ